MTESMSKGEAYFGWLPCPEAWLTFVWRLRETGLGQLDFIVSFKAFFEISIVMYDEQRLIRWTEGSLLDSKA